MPDLSENVSYSLEDMQNKEKAMSDKNIPFWTSLLSWVQRLVENYCHCCHNHSNHSALQALLLIMSCKFYNPEIDSTVSCGWPEG